LGAEHVDEVLVWRSALQPAGGVGWEQPRDAALAVFGPAAEAELAVDHGASVGAFGVVVGRHDPAVVGECPERRPDLQQRAGEASAVAERTLLSA
jgi:hypothetical protein